MFSLCDNVANNAVFVVFIVLTLFLGTIEFRHSGVDNFVTPQMKEFEAPLLASLPEAVNGLTLQEIYLKLLNPFRFSKIDRTIAAWMVQSTKIRLQSDNPT